MADTFRHIINMANSIIGVSILSMPYCFKEAGLILGVLLILFSGFITKKTCMFLIQAAMMARRRSYELLAFQVFGVTGKLLMEMCMILFLIGICISFHVVMGDIAPSIMAKYMAIENSSSLRCTLLIGMVVLVILPLCLLRNLDSLASMSACSIGFYIFLNCIIFYMALPNLLDGSWLQRVELFHLDSIFRVIPIMTLALACQSNVFEIYDAIPDPDVLKMRTVVSQAVNICCALYIGVGFLGYVAFVDRDISGNIILSFPVSNLTDGMTVFFVFSLAISFPLIMFPCRTSIHSLLYRRNTQITYDIVGNYMPESRFKAITLSVLSISLIVGIMLPNIEFVLGLLGSTMGVIIALIFPSIFFIKVYTKTSCDRLLAQGFLLLGIIVMVTGSYLHLGGLQEQNPGLVTTAPVFARPHEMLKKEVPEDFVQESPIVVNHNDEVKVLNVDMTGRKEPAIPEPPPNVEKELPPQKVDSKNFIPPSEEPEKVIKKSKIDKGLQEPPGSVVKKLDEREVRLKEESILIEAKKDVKEEVLHPDAIKKEEKENAEEAQGKGPLSQESKDIEKKQEQILKQMENQQKEQKMLIEEQKKILQELRDQKEKVQQENVLEESKAEARVEAVRPEASQNKREPQEIISAGAMVSNQSPAEHVNPAANALGVNQNIAKGAIEPNIPPNSLVGESIPVQEPVRKEKDISHRNIDSKSLRKLPLDKGLVIPVVNQKMIAKKGPSVQEDTNLLKMQNPPIPNIQVSGEINSKGQLNQIDSLSVAKAELDLPLNPALHSKQVNNDQVFNQLPSAVKPVHDLLEKSPSKHQPQSINLIGNIAYPKERLGSANNASLKLASKPGQSALQRPNKTNLGNSDSLIKKLVGEAELGAKYDGDKLPENQPLEGDLKHDEERRKRDLASMDGMIRERDSEETKIQLSDRLSLDYLNNVNLNQKDLIPKQEAQKALDAAYDTRHLLWVGRRTRRKKRRQEQFPNYWDEM